MITRRAVVSSASYPVRPPASFYSAIVVQAGAATGRDASLSQRAAPQRGHEFGDTERRAHSLRHPRILRAGSSVRLSTRFLTERSRVQIPPSPWGSWWLTLTTVPGHLPGLDSPTRRDWSRNPGPRPTLDRQIQASSSVMAGELGWRGSHRDQLLGVRRMALCAASRGSSGTTTSTAVKDFDPHG